MAKQLFLAFLVGFTSIVLCPTVLDASDSFIARQPDFSAFESYLNEQETIAKEAEAKQAEIIADIEAAAHSNQSVFTRLANSTPISTPNAGANILNFQITRSIAYSEYEAASSDPGNNIYRFAKLIFAHNTPALFGNLATLTPGQTITLTENGQTHSYRVATSEVVPKINGYLNGDPYFVNNLAYKAGGHSFALLTCSGQMLGGGDATHRLIVYIDAI